MEQTATENVYSEHYVAFIDILGFTNHVRQSEHNWSKNGQDKKIVRRTWSKEDVRTLKTMAKSKTGAAKISKALKRIFGATIVKASKLGVSLDTRG